MPRCFLRPMLIVLGLLTPGVAAGQNRPFLTEPAQTSAAGTLLLESGGDFMSGEPNFLTGAERDVWAGPLLRLTYSPADNVELDLEWVARVGARDDPEFGSVSDFGDVTLRAKWRLNDDRPGRPVLGVRWVVTLPQTSFGEGLGPNTLRMAVQGLLSQRWGSLAAHLNVGLAIHDEALRPHEQRDFLAYGVALVQSLGERAALGAEWTGLAGSGMPGADEHTELRVGLRLGGPRVTFDGAVRRGLAAADGSWGVTAGVTIRFGS